MAKVFRVHGVTAGHQWSVVSGGGGLHHCRPLYRIDLLSGSTHWLALDAQGKLRDRETFRHKGEGESVGDVTFPLTNNNRGTCPVLQGLAAASLIVSTLRILHAILTTNNCEIAWNKDLLFSCHVGNLGCHFTQCRFYLNVWICPSNTFYLMFRLRVNIYNATVRTLHNDKQRQSCRHNRAANEPSWSLKLEEKSRLLELPHLRQY